MGEDYRMSFFDEEEQEDDGVDVEEDRNVDEEDEEEEDPDDLDPRTPPGAGATAARRGLKRLQGRRRSPFPSAPAAPGRKPETRGQRPANSRCDCAT